MIQLNMEVIIDARGAAAQGAGAHVSIARIRRRKSVHEAPSGGGEEALGRPNERGGPVWI